MLLLTGTGDKIRAVTGQAVTVDSVLFWTDYNASTVAGGHTLAAITTATTTDSSGSPAASTTRKVKSGFWRNKHASLSVDLTIQFYDGTNAYEMWKTTLKPGEQLEYMEGIGFFQGAAPSMPAPTFIAATQAIGASTTDYVAGSGIVIPTLRPLVVGSIMEWELILTKTAASTATLSFLIKSGTGGAVGDTTRLTATTAANTAVADVAWVRAQAMVRTLGASGTIHFAFHMTHNLQITGFDTKPDLIVEAVQTIDTTVSGLIFGFAITTGAAHALTIQQVTGFLKNV